MVSEVLPLGLLLELIISFGEKLGSPLRSPGALFNEVGLAVGSNVLSVGLSLGMLLG